MTRGRRQPQRLPTGSIIIQRRQCGNTSRRFFVGSLSFLYTRSSTGRTYIHVHTTPFAFFTCYNTYVRLVDIIYFTTRIYRFALHIRVKNEITVQFKTYYRQRVNRSIDISIAFLEEQSENNSFCMINVYLYLFVESNRLGCMIWVI